MAPKKSSTPQPPSKTSTTTSTPAKPSTTTRPSSHPSLLDINDLQQIANGVYNNYNTRTPPKTKLLDAFLGFLAIVGALQFIYCVVGGNYPFNAFLSGFGATVGQIVLTASLRMQTNVENKAEFEKISHERAFADYIFGSMILHFFCVNFIN